MPITSLESYLFERKFANASSIEILQNAVIGIDVEHYLSRIYTFKKEQFLPAIGGAPSSLRDYIKSDLKVFQEFNIKPIFVISGLHTQLEQKYKNNLIEFDTQHVENTWNKVNSKDPYGHGFHHQHSHSHSANIDGFRNLNEPLPIYSMINYIIKFFLEFDIDYMISPYDASFQLSYLYQSGIIDIVYGSTDLLLTKIDKFILGMEFQSKDFRFVNKNKVLKGLNLSERQFLDLCIIVGCGVQPETFPLFSALSNKPPSGGDMPSSSSTSSYGVGGSAIGSGSAPGAPGSGSGPAGPGAGSQLSYFKIGLDILYQYAQFSGDNSSLLGYIITLNNPKLLDLYYKGVCAIRYMPILNQEGYVELYHVAMAKLGLSENIDFLHQEEEEVVGRQIQAENQQVKGRNAEVKQTKQGGETDNEKSNADSNTLHRSVRIPNDVHEIISQRLPPELYFYQSMGLLPLALLGSIVKGELIIRAPLEGGMGNRSNESYKNLITLKFYVELLDSQFNLITQFLARYYQVKKIRVKYWFKKDILELNNRFTPPISKKLNKFIISDDGAGENFAISKFFHSRLNGEYTSTKTVGTRSDIISTVLLRALYLYGIVNDKSELSSIGKILVEFAKSVNSDISQEDFEHIILLVLLLDSKTLKLNEPSKEYTDVSNYYKKSMVDQQQQQQQQQQYSNQFSKQGLADDIVKKITLISRMFSFKKLNVSPINYQGPISRSLLNFRSHVEFINYNLINTLQLVLVDFIVRQEQNSIKTDYETKDDWYKLIDQLPFYKSLNNTLMGVISEIYFEVAIKQKQGQPQLTKEEIIKNCQNHLADHIFSVNIPSFNINVNGINSTSKTQLNNDFKQGVEWWKKFIILVDIINKIDKKLVDDSLYQEIKQADEFLKEFV